MKKIYGMFLLWITIFPIVTLLMVRDLVSMLLKKVLDPLAKRATNWAAGVYNFKV